MQDRKLDTSVMSGGLDLVLAGGDKEKDIHDQVLDVYNKVRSERGQPQVTFEELEVLMDQLVPGVNVKDLDAVLVEEQFGIPALVIIHLQGWAAKKYFGGIDTWYSMPWDEFLMVIKNAGFTIRYLQKHQAPITELRPEERDSWVLIADREGIFLFADSYPSYGEGETVNGFYFYAEVDKEQRKHIERCSSFPLWTGPFTPGEENFTGRYHIDMGMQTGCISAFDHVERIAGKIQVPKYKIPLCWAPFSWEKPGDALDRRGTERVHRVLKEVGLSKYFARDYANHPVPAE